MFKNSKEGTQTQPSNQKSASVEQPTFSWQPQVQAGYPLPCTEKKFWEIADNLAVERKCDAYAAICAKYERGEMSKEQFEVMKKKSKGTLPVLIFGGTFPQGVARKNENVLPNGLCMVDFDHLADDAEGIRKFYKEVVEQRIKEAIYRILYAHITPSGRGLRLVEVIPEGMTPKQVQQQTAQMLGLSAYLDKGTHDLSRCSFAVPRKNMLFINDAIFSLQKIDAIRGTLKVSELSEVSEVSDNSEVSEFSPYPQEVRGTSFKDIYAALSMKKHGRVITADDEGHRHTMLRDYAILARYLTNSQAEWLKAVMPDLQLPEGEVDDIVKWALAQPFNLFSLKAAEGLVAEVHKNHTVHTLAEAPTLSKSLLRRLPEAVRATISRTPEWLHWPLIASMLPIAGVCADGVTLTYLNDDIHYAALMSVIIGEQASGKSNCARLVEEWMQHFLAADAMVQLQEDAWKKKLKRRKANEDIGPEPELVKHIVPARISTAALLSRLKKNQGHAIFTLCEELDEMTVGNSAGAWANKTAIYRLAFDHGLYGQDYKSADSESGMVGVAYNWTFLGTPQAMRRCFHGGNSVENGLVGRITFALLPNRNYCSLPNIPKRSADEVEAIHTMATRLTKAQGNLHLPNLLKATNKWLEEQRAKAQEAQDLAWDKFRIRAAVIAFRAACLVHLMTLTDVELKDVSTQTKASQAIIDFFRYVADNALLATYMLFGKEYNDHAAHPVIPIVTPNDEIFAKLSDEFTADDIRRLKQQQGVQVSRNAIANIGKRWTDRGLTVKIGQGRWKKRTA